MNSNTERNNPAKIEIREVIDGVPVKFFIYPRGAQIGNHAHSLMSPATDYTWYVVGEIDTTDMTDDEFFASPLAVFEGVSWQHSAQTVNSYDKTLNDVRNMARRDIAKRLPDSQTDAEQQRNYTLTPVEAALVDRYRRGLEIEQQQSCAAPEANPQTQHDADFCNAAEVLAFAVITRLVVIDVLPRSAVTGDSLNVTIFDVAEALAETAKRIGIGDLTK